jgi:splicing factor 3B subunit 1
VLLPRAQWRLNNKSARVRQQAADLVQRIAVVMNLCSETKLMGHLGVVLYEYLGEEYPEVLGSILGALKGMLAVGWMWVGWVVGVRMDK